MMSGFATEPEMTSCGAEEIFKWRRRAGGDSNNKLDYFTVISVVGIVCFLKYLPYGPSTPSLPGPGKHRTAARGIDHHEPLATLIYIQVAGWSGGQPAVYKFQRFISWPLAVKGLSMHLPLLKIRAVNVVMKCFFVWLFSGRLMHGQRVTINCHFPIFRRITLPSHTTICGLKVNSFETCCIRIRGIMQLVRMQLALNVLEILINKLTSGVHFMSLSY